MEEFKNLLSKYMQREGLNGDRLAEELKVSRTTIHNWCTGQVKKFRCEKLEKCAEVLHLSPEERREFLIAAGCLLENDAPLVPIVNIPILRPNQFFGRKKELNRIFGRWRHRPLHNVAIIGPRRSGKTSLLHYLKNIHTVTQLRKGQRQDWLPTDTQFVFVDFQAAGMCEQEPLLCYLLEELNIPVPEPCNLAHFTKVMRRELQQPTVILMDRIDVGLQSPQLDYQFWWAIRALVTNYTNGNLGLLVASPQPPTEVMPTGGDNQPSPFLNIIAEIVKLGPLTENEARELLEHTPQPFAEADVEWILKNSGRWPALLQILCDVRLRALEEREQGEGWKKEGLARIKPYQCKLD